MQPQQQQQQAIQMQPTGSSDVQWMQKPQMISGVPPGLEYLAQLDQVVVKQIKELLEILTGWETKNKYRMMNSMGQQCFFAFEESGVCM